MFPMGPGSRRLLNQSTYKPVGDARIAVRPPEGGYFQILHVAPLPLAVEQFAFVNTVYRLDEGLVVAVTNAADRWVDASFGQSPYVSTIALCIDNRSVYRMDRYCPSRCPAVVCKANHERVDPSEEVVPYNGTTNSSL
jgi:hypothetical protein